MIDFLSLPIEQDTQDDNTRASDLCASMSAFALVLEFIMEGQMIGKDTSTPLENRANQLSLFDKTEEGGVTVQTKYIG